ncbi:MAG: nucleotidyltransferase domain-containing protein [Thermoprotei archaeon]
MNEIWLNREYIEKRKWYFENLDRVVQMIRSVLDKFFSSYEIYLFGSVAEDDYTMASDIDILVVSDETPKKISERSRIISEVYRVIGFDAPVEIHLVDNKGFQWYKKFVKKFVKLYP